MSALSSTARAEGIELVSIATLNGRVTIPFRVAGYGAEWNGKSPARLVVKDVGARSGKTVRRHPHPNPPPKPVGEGRHSSAGEEVTARRGESPFELLIAVSLPVVESGVLSG